MSNKITYESPACPKPVFSSMHIGQVFRFPGSAYENVYMRITTIDKVNCVLLRTGAAIAANSLAEVVPITVPVTISSDAC
jgi:hypothetical protein